jgi:hypothetical protein
MRIAYLNAIKCSALMLSLLAANVYAQDSAPANEPDKKIDAVTPVAESDAKTTAVKKTDTNPAQPAKKMVQDASITLQTTITGNQEQPRVLYILPWQSPTAANVDFESLDNEQKAVFGHVEREELRRELEASEEVK